MSAELTFLLALGNAPDVVTISVLSGGNVAPQAVVHKPVLALDMSKLEEFRRGDLSAADLETMTAAVNDWLLDPEVRGILKNALPSKAGGQNREGLRLSFVVGDNIRDAIAPIPLELLWHDTPQAPLVLRKDIESLAYLFSKATSAPENVATRNWPLKILIVRANPADWGGKVPKVAPLKVRILDEAKGYGPGMVDVDVLSSEDTPDTPASWQALLAHLRRTTDYSILVYIGHGELAEPPSGGAPIGQLYMESPDGGGHQAIGAPQIAKLLSDHPIPIVMLAGCVTAVEQGNLVRRRGAEQGVAQALVNSSEAGVQMAVGMRMEVLGTAAMTFLGEFFSSLLKRAPGDLDRAVREARNALFLETGPYPPHWAAPVVFRAVDRIPGFEFLKQPVMFRVSEAMAKWLELRTLVWKQLPDAITHIDDPRLTGIFELLAEAENGLRRDGAQQGPLLLPRRARVKSGETDTIAIEIVGKLTVSTLSARLDVPAALTVQRLKLSDPAKAAGFKLFADQDDLREFEVRAVNGQSAVLPEGVLLQAEVAAAGGTAVHPVTINLRAVEPRTPLWPGDNVVLVTP